MLYILHFLFQQTAVCARFTKFQEPEPGNVEQGRNHGFFFGKAKPMGGHNLSLLVEIGLKYLKI